MTDEIKNPSWFNYGKVYHLGRVETLNLYSEPVTVEEKIDGSQFNFGIIDGALRCASKSVEINMAKPDKMFGLAVEFVKSIANKLLPGHVYHCEYLQKPRHNVLAYNRIPKNHLMLFDVSSWPYHGMPVSHWSLSAEARRLDIDIVPQLLPADTIDSETLLKMLDRESVLGGQKIEGIVVKSLDRQRRGKYVSEAFKESRVYNGTRDKKPLTSSFEEKLGIGYATLARWNKAIQHLRDRGELTSSPTDIPALIKEVKADLAAEEGATIKEALFDYYFPKVAQAAIRGLPEVYKKRLLTDGDALKDNLTNE